MTRCLSGLKGRSAKALFVGSNPTLVSKKCNFLKITDIYYKKEIKWVNTEKIWRSLSAILVNGLIYFRVHKLKGDTLFGSEIFKPWYCEQTRIKVFFIAKNLVIWNKNSIFASWNNDLVAQLVCVCLEHLPFKQGVVGSNPTGVTRINSVDGNMYIGRLYTMCRRECMTWFFFWKLK